MSEVNAQKVKTQPTVKVKEIIYFFIERNLREK